MLHLSDLRQLEPGLGELGVQGDHGRSPLIAFGRSVNDLGLSAVVEDVESALLAPANRSIVFELPGTLTKPLGASSECYRELKAIMLIVG